MLPVFLISVLLIAAFQTNASTEPTPIILTSGDPPNTTTHLSLWNGTVNPYKQLGPADFNFTVRLRTAGVNATNVTVRLNLTQVRGLTPVASNYTMLMDPTHPRTTNSAWYYLQKRLDAGVYEFGFYANDGRGNVSATLAPLGPLAAQYGDYYFLWIYISALYLIIPYSFYFIIIFMYWYTGRMRKMRSRMIDLAAKRKADKDEAKPASEGKGEEGKAAKAAAFTCTNCGADVEEADDKCPKCGATFED